MAADTVVFLVDGKPDWLAGRYISCTWEVSRLMSMKDENISKDKLKVRMVL